MTNKISKKILFVASTFPVDEYDPVPPFVREEAIWAKKVFPGLQIDVLSPHNSYSDTKNLPKNDFYTDYRFHYFWPHKFELLAGRGIMPALKSNKLLYLEVPFFTLFEIIAVIRRTITLKPDLIYAHWFMPQAIAAAIASKITRTPFVFDTQSSDVIVLKKFPFSKSIVRWVCKNSIAYTAPSKQTADKLLYFNEPSKYDISEKLNMIPLGTSPVKVSDSEKRKTLSKFNLSSTEYLYFIGRLVERKGVHILIQAFANFNKLHPKVMLVVTGDGPERERLENEVVDLGIKDRVIFTGFLSKVERFSILEGCTMGVVPSLNVGDQGEGLPIVFMEGVTVGKPMVITDATGAHEYVSDGKTAFIAKSESVKSLQDKISEAYSERNSDKLRSNVKKLSDDFQWTNIVKKRFDLFFPD